MEDKVIDLLDGLETAITNLAPQAWDALVTAAYVEALADLAMVVVSVAYTGFFAVIATRKAAPALIHSESESEFIPWLVFSILGGFGVVVAVMNIMLTAFSSRMWLGLLSPESMVVRQLLKSLT